jgi:iron complex outermembrane recepter protein
MKTQNQRGLSRALKWTLLCSAGLALPATLHAQETPVEEQAAADAPAEEVTEIIVDGIRQTQRTSAQVKKQSDLIVDALVSDEIGATPDQSVGETLERIVGVSGDRFKGSASEISIRGLGPFLGFSTLNGREVSSGGGDRAVSFQQFPSELVNGVLVYKSQSASLVEGGTSGVIELRTLRPVDFGKRRIQIDLRGVYEPYDDKINDRNGIGARASFSYIDQFDVGDGRMGISLGYSHADESAPEDFYTESSSVRPCNTITALTANCAVTPALLNSTTNPTYFVANSYSWRQQNNAQKRDAFIGSIQYKPRPELDINIDGQYSTRFFEEDRTDLLIADGRRGIRPVTVAPNGALIAFDGNSIFESQTRLRRRDEDYLGGGLSVAWTDDAAKIALDVSYSRSEREQVDRSARLRTDGTRSFLINGVATNFTGGRIPYRLDRSSGEPVLTLGTLTSGGTVNLDDHGIFSAGAFARRDSESREDEIFAVRLDGEAFISEGFFRSIKVGARFSDHSRIADLDNQNRNATTRDGTDQVFTAAQNTTANLSCRIEFRDPQFFSDASTNVNSFAQFDPTCLFRTLTGSVDTGPAANPISTSDIDVTEKILAGYAETTFGNKDDSFAGSLGVRVINTNVASNGFRTDFNAVQTAGSFSLVPTGNFTPVRIKNDFWSILPSLNVKFSPAENVLLRGAVYKALSRPNIEDERAGRDFLTDAANNLTIADAISGVSGGNPRLLPLESWNGDLSFEWYPEKDTTLALALFYKQLKAGVRPADSNSTPETFIINSTAVTVPVAQQGNDNTKRDLWGLEVTVNHAFSYLPGLLNGFGVSAGYGYADTNFEYPDPSAVDPANPLRNFTDPASIIGLSKHTASAQLYYEKGPVGLRAQYKYRSGYLKPFELNANRFVQSNTNLDLSATLDLTKQVRLRFEALNVLNQAQYLERPVPGAISEVSYYGPRYYAGVRIRF